MNTDQALSILLSLSLDPVRSLVKWLAKYASTLTMHCTVHLTIEGKNA